MENIQEGKEGPKLLETKERVVDVHPQIETGSRLAEVRDVESDSRVDNSLPKVESRDENADSILDEEEQHAKMLRMERRRLEAAQLAQEVRIISSQNVVEKTVKKQLYKDVFSLHRQNG